MSNFEQLIEYLEAQSNIDTVYDNKSHFVSVQCGIAKPIGREQTNKIREMGFDVGDITTDQVGSKHNPTRVLRVWFYPHGSDELAA